MKNKGQYHFCAMLSRMKYITRWGLMNNTKSENISEHSLQTAFFAHILAVIENKRFGKSLNPERCALLAMYHDCSEIFTGDLPTPVKYFDPQIISAYKNVERISEEKLVSMLPEDLREEYSSVLFFEQDGDEELKKYVKAADKLSALVKCIEELRMGNDEFKKAKESTENALTEMDMPCVEVFMEEFLPSFYLSLDEQE
ncbi:MAG: 5'-deoxynucleotidase [Ruminococcus sp.]